MPSLWSWLSGRKHRITSSKHQEFAENGEDLSKQRKRHHFGLKDKEVTKSKVLPSDRQIPLFNKQSELPHLPPTSKEIERTKDNDNKNDARKVDASLQGAAKRRLLAYEIFDNAHAPIKNISKEKTNYQSSSGSEHNSRYSQEESEFPRQERENVDIFGVEMRQRHIFGGLASKFQRHSLQAVYPEYGRDARKGQEYRRSETMAGYVPKVVSLHDASSILSGGIKEGTPSSKQMNAKFDRFFYSHGLSPRNYEVVPNSRPNSSHQCQQLSSSRDSSQHGSHNMGRNLRQSKVEDLKFHKMSGESSNKLRQRISNGNYAPPPSSSGNYVTPASSNRNFYFSSSMLSPILSGSQTVDPSPLEDVHFTALDELFKATSAKPSVHPTNNKHEYDVRSNKITQNGRNNNNISSVFTKVPNNNSQDYSTFSKLLGRTNINKNSADNDSDETVPSVLEHFEKTKDNSKDGTHNDHLEGIFNTDGEVLY